MEIAVGQIKEKQKASGRFDKDFVYCEKDTWFHARGALALARSSHSDFGGSVAAGRTELHISACEARVRVHTLRVCLFLSARVSV